MKILKLTLFIFTFNWLWLSGNVQTFAYGEESLGEAIDCTDVRVEYVDDPTLTPEERLRLMDKAFFESLNRFEMCQAAKEKAKAGGGSGASGGGGGGGNGLSGNEGKTGNQNEKGTAETAAGSAVESVASSSMSGTEPAEKVVEVDGTQAQDAGNTQGSEEIQGSRDSGGNMARANGKLPEDIPSAKNDDALAAQIRYAAENEPDPEKSKKLWNEYRKYKGLAVQQ